MLLSLKKKEHKVEILKSQIVENKKVRNEAKKNIEQLKEELFCLQLNLISKKVRNFKKMNSKMNKNDFAYLEFLAKHTNKLRWIPLSRQKVHYF